MSYFDWRGNKQGKNIYDTKIPVAICLLLPVVAILCLLLGGCAGSGRIKEYEMVEGKLTLTRETVFRGVNIKGKTKDGATIETKTAIEFPKFGDIEFEKE